MSAKITLIFFILIFFEIGILLVVIPWLHSPSWGENYFLVYAADKLHWPWLANALRSGYVRGAVTGLGLLNIMIGIFEIINFRKTARAFQARIDREIYGEALQSPQAASDKPEENANNTSAN